MKKIYYTVFTLLVLSAIIYVGVDAFYRIVRAEFTGVEINKIVAVKPAVYTIPGQPSFDQYRIIAQRNLFGSVEETQARTKENSVEALQPTSLKLALLGTVSGDPESAVAVIREMGKNKEGLFKVGDAIERATVKKILRGKVILRVGNRDEVLSMKEPTSSKQGKAPGIVNPSRPEGGRTITISRSELERSIQNINSLLSQARVRPSFNKGKPNGLVVDQIRANSFFSKLGLRNGDIVNRVNGRLIRSPADIISAYNRLQSGSPISLTISRRGQQETLNYIFQ